LSPAPPDKPEVHSLKSTFIVAPAFKDHKGTFFRTCNPGTYDLFISAGKQDGTPLYELPYADEDGHKRYKIGRVVLTDYKQ
jgi:hypothetical protein